MQTLEYLKPAEVKELSQRVGGLSKPSKMPCEGYSLPAQKCITGSKLRKAGKSTCANCYALKGFYNMPSVKNALEKRFEKVTQDLQAWQADMTLLIHNTNQSGFFRWHDSGDLQSVEHLRAINAIALALPNVKFWIPTREYKIVQEFTDSETVADNLIIRLSAYFKSSAPPLATAEAMGVHTSTVDFTDSAHICDAQEKGGRCMTCRKCWDKSLTNIDYPLH